MGNKEIPCKKCNQYVINCECNRASVIEREQNYKAGFLNLMIYWRHKLKESLTNGKD